MIDWSNPDDVRRYLNQRWQRSVAPPAGQGGKGAVMGQALEPMSYPPQEGKGAVMGQALGAVPYPSPYPPQEGKGAVMGQALGAVPYPSPYPLFPSAGQGEKGVAMGQSLESMPSPSSPAPSPTNQGGRGLLPPQTQTYSRNDLYFQNWKYPEDVRLVMGRDIKALLPSDIPLHPTATQATRITGLSEPGMATGKNKAAPKSQKGLPSPLSYR